MSRNIVLAITLAAACGPFASAQSRGQDQVFTAELRGHRPQIAAAPGGSSKLSPALLATRDSGGVLRGSDISGNPVISVPQANVASFSRSAAVRSVLAATPTNYFPVKRLKLSYQGGNRPTDQELRSMGLKLVEDYQKGSFLIVEPLDNQINAQLATKLENSASVAYAAPLLRIKAIPPTNPLGVRRADLTSRTTAAATPQPTNDPGWTSLCSIGDGLWGMRNIHAPAAWAQIHDSPVVVAVIDTGFDYTHEDLRDNVWSDPSGKHGFDFVDNDDDPMDQNSHGTHCSGTIGAVGNNGAGVVGVNWKVKIMGVRWLDASGSGDVANAIKAIDWAVDHGAKVLSNSWFWPEDDPDLEAAIKRANDQQVLFVAAAGNFAMKPGNHGGDNDNSDTYGRYPSAYSLNNIIAVAAIDVSDQRANFSQFGKTTVDLGAPGVDILSTIPQNNYDCTFSGTSMATPHVAGATALTIARYPSATFIDIKESLLKNARKIDALKDRCVTDGTLDLSFLGNAN